MTSVFSWQNSVSLCPASFCTSRPHLPITPGVLWLPTFAFHSPIMKRTSFLDGSCRRSLGLHKTLQLQLLQHYWSGHKLGLLWYWMVCLGNKQRSFCHFWDCICGIRWQSRRTCTHVLLRELQNYNLLLNNCWLENVESHQKQCPMSKDKGEALAR